MDGFKKILKTEVCPFEDCKFSTVCNHIHCVREGCDYILHSSSQMISHKRKHDRQDGEQAYQQFKCKQEDAGESSLDATPQLQQPLGVTQSNHAGCGSNTNTSTPLSSLSAEHFLSRKRGRPPKKIVSIFYTYYTYFLYLKYINYFLTCSNCRPMPRNPTASV